jgi:aminoglycoside phosphotransferase family enzyme
VGKLVDDLRARLGELRETHISWVPDLGETLLAAYARESNDFELYRLIDFYESYRAYVRAKVESFVEQDPSLTEVARARIRNKPRGPSTQRCARAPTPCWPAVDR